MTSGTSAGPSVERSRKFAADPHPRFWWHHDPEHDYVPAIYQVLSDAEWDIMEQWYATTQAADCIGEINVPAMSLIHGLISGSGLTRIVQLGHYYGYSTLLIGFWLRAMGQGGKLVSIDIDPDATGFTNEWVQRAGLQDQVHLSLCDSAGPQALGEPLTAFDGAMPQLILLDSSHQYAHTVRELQLWVPAMDQHSLMLLHDSSFYARQWDKDGAGGVQQALDDVLRRRKLHVEFINLNRRVGEPGTAEALVYDDGCGVGILQKL